MCHCVCLYKIEQELAETATSTGQTSSRVALDGEETASDGRYRL